MQADTFVDERMKILYVLVLGKFGLVQFWAIFAGPETGRSGLRSGKNGPEPDQTELPQHYSCPGPLPYASAIVHACVFVFACPHPHLAPLLASMSLGFSS